MALVEITEANFEELVEKSDKIVVLDLWAEWCGPCRMIAPHFKEMAEEYEGKAVIGKVDIDSNQGIAQKFMVMNIPTVLYLKNGKVVNKIVGAGPKKKYVKALEKLL